MVVLWFSYGQSLKDGRRLGPMVQWSSLVQSHKSHATMDTKATPGRLLPWKMPVFAIFIVDLHGFTHENSMVDLSIGVCVHVYHFGYLHHFAISRSFTGWIYGSSQAGTQHVGRLEGCQASWKTTIRKEKKHGGNRKCFMKLWTSTIHRIHSTQICFCKKLQDCQATHSECCFSHSVECQSTLSFSHFYFHQLVSRKNCSGRMRSLERTRGEKPPFLGGENWRFLDKFRSWLSESQSCPSLVWIVLPLLYH